MSEPVRSGTLKLAIATMVASLGGYGVIAWFAGGWKPATILNLSIVAVLLAWALFTKDELLKKLLVFGGVAGVVELYTGDPWFIRREVLVYNEGGPFLVDSPFYMPFAWAYVVVQLAVIALWLIDRYGMPKAAAIVAVLGAGSIPLYESLAKNAQLWIYQGCGEIFSAPYFVILAEMLIALSFPFLGDRVRKSGYAMAAVLGAAAGLWMWVAGMIGYKLVCFPG